MTDAGGSGRCTGDPGRCTGDPGFKIYLRDINEDMAAAWSHEDAFGQDSFKTQVEVRVLKLCKIVL